MNAGSEDDIVEIDPPFEWAQRKKHMKAPSTSSDIVILASDEDNGPGSSKNRPQLAQSPRRALTELMNDVPPTAGSPAPPVDPIDALFASVLEIIPDVEPGHLRTLLLENYPVHHKNTAEHVLHQLFEDASYPRSEKTNGKRKRSVDDEGGPAKRPTYDVDYTDITREYKGGQWYFEMALEQLGVDFPYAPKPYLRDILRSKNGFYVPT